MNLMKFFNRNYMIQNLKKSKSILAFFLGIIPIISLLSFLVFANNTSYANISLETISIVHYVFVYFIPIILSFCLFGFVYKKKSVDFTLSMPVSKKTIFLTNTITGILLLVLTVVLSAIGIYIASTFMNIILPFRMIVDYILVWSTTYIFVFILSNIAMSTSGNISTQVIVTLLLLFLIPFTLDYISSLSERTYFQPEYYICLENMDVKNTECYFSNNHALTSFTIPYNNIRIFGGGVYQLWNIVSIIKMMTLSVVGYFIGKYLFLKRKMEVNETSFQSLKTHNIIKGLTIFPIIVVIKKLIPDPAPPNDINYLPILIALIFLLIYSFIYDLITRKSISQVKVCLKHFMITVISVCVFCMICENFLILSSNETIYAQDKDITEYQIPLNGSDFTEFSYVTLNEPDLVSSITNLLIETTNPIYASKELRIKINGKLYTIDVYFGKEQYQELMTKIKDVMKKKTSDGIINTNKVFALGFNHWELTQNTNNSKIIKEAKEAVKTGKKCDERYQFSISTNLYAYQNGRIISYPVESCTSEVLDDYVVSTLQKENERLHQEMGRNGYHTVWNLGFNVTLHHYPESYPCINCNVQTSKKEEELFQLIKKYKNDTFTSKKDYISLTVWYNGVNYVYHTNRIDEFMNVFNKEEDSNDIN